MQPVTSYLPAMSMKIRGSIDRIFGRGVIPKKAIRYYLPKDPIILEAGAHTGKDTTEMARLWKKGHIHAFEPVPVLYRKLLQRTSHYPNITCYPLALGSITGKQELFISSGQSDGSSSLLEPKDHLKLFPHVHFKRGTLIDVITIDNWMKEYQIPKIDFMWLDLQGMELGVLMEGLNALKTTSAIYTEVSEFENYVGQGRYGVLKNWMKITGFTAKLDATTNGEGNVLWTRTDGKIFNK